MKFLRNRLAMIFCAVVLVASVTAGTASAATALPTLGTRLYYILGSVMFGGMISSPSAALDTTAVAGHIEFLPTFLTSSTLRPLTNSSTSGTPYKSKFIAYLRGTGSTTLRYGAGCFPNPFKGVSGGSGVVLRLDYHAGNNPAGLGGDIGFVKSCTGHAAGDATASGSDLINDVCTGTGCISSYTTGTAAFNNVDYIKFTPRGNLTSSYTGRITGEVINIWGE